MAHAPARSPLARLFKQWHQQLLGSAPAGVEPILRLTSGASWLVGARVDVIDNALRQVLPLIGAGLASVPPGFRGISLRAKVLLALRVDAAGLHIDVSYFGRAPDAHALQALSKALDDAVYIDVEGARDQAVHLRLIQHEPPREMAVVLVEAGETIVALPMSLIRRGEPWHDDDASAASLSACLGLEPRFSRIGRPAVLHLSLAGGDRAIKVDAVIGHRNARLYCVGPLIGCLPWVLGAVENAGSPPVVVIDPRRILPRR